MITENDSTIEASLKNIKILGFDAKYIDEVLRIQDEAGLSFWSKEDYLSETERADSISKIAVSGKEKIVGFALARLLISAEGQSFSGSQISFDSSEILNIAVAREFRRYGVGQMIFDRLLLELRQKKISDIWLEVRKSNFAAINFYRRNDFAEQFERKNYYRNPNENACVFRRLII